MLETFADPVKNDNRVINRITSDGEDGADHDERKLSPDQGKHSHGNEHVVKKGNKRAEGKRKFKPEGHVDENADHAQGKCQRGPLAKLQADLRPDVFLRHRSYVSIAIRFLQLCKDLGRSALRAANRKSVLHAFALELNDDIPQTNAFERLARFGDGHRLFGIDHQQIPTTKVDAEISLAPEREDGDGSANQRQGNKSGKTPLPEEVKLPLWDEIQHSELLQAEAFDEPAEHRPGHQQSGEHRGDDAECQSNGKTLHRAGRLPEKDHRRDQGRDVSVEDCAEGLVVGSLEGSLER